MLINVTDNGSVAQVPVMQTYQTTASTTCTTITTETPTIVLKGCTFTGCAISMSGEASYETSIAMVLRHCRL